MSTEYKNLIDSISGRDVKNIERDYLRIVKVCASEIKKSAVKKNYSKEKLPVIQLLLCANVVAGLLETFEELFRKDNVGYNDDTLYDVVKGLIRYTKDEYYGIDSE